jgi:hypothetical protein
MTSTKRTVTFYKMACSLGAPSTPKSSVAAISWCGVMIGNSGPLPSAVIENANA